MIVESKLNLACRWMRSARFAFSKRLVLTLGFDFFGWKLQKNSFQNPT